jgi:hypothetical protein
VQAWALVEIGDDHAVDVFVRQEDAFPALEDAVSDEQSWARTLLVVPIQLDERDMSPS